MAPVTEDPVDSGLPGECLPQSRHADDPGFERMALLALGAPAEVIAIEELPPSGLA